MRVLYDRINTISATNENASFPDDNMLTPYQGQLFKSTNTTSVITINSVTTAGVNGNAFYIGNTNATEGSYSLYDDTNTLVETVSFDVDNRDSLIDIITGTKRQGFIEHWQLFGTYQPAAFKLVITLTTTAATLYVGIIRTGLADHFTNPNYGWQQNIIDTSIVNSTNIGATYILNRDKIRVFNGDFIAMPNDDFYKFQDLYYKLQGQSTAFYFVDDGTSSRQMCFGKLQQPSSTFPSFELGNWSINITEEL